MPRAGEESRRIRAIEVLKQVHFHRFLDAASAMKDYVRRLVWLLAFIQGGVADGLLAGPIGDWSRMSAIISQGYVCYRASGTVNIDGRLDEPAWQTVGWSKDFVDIEGNVKPRPRLRTRVKMLWDDDYFYVGAELAEHTSGPRSLSTTP